MEMTIVDKARIITTTELLHPCCRERFEQLADYAARCYAGKHVSVLFAIFETYRSPERQQHLFATTKSTKSKAWESDHQYGLSCDFAVRRPAPGNPGSYVWSWDAPPDAWDWLHNAAPRFQLAWPGWKWDQGHIRDPRAPSIRKILTNS